MPTKTYTRKLLANGSYGNPTEGAPSFVSEITTALPGRLWVVNADGANVSVVISGANLTAQESTNLDTAYANWSPDDLDAYKQSVIVKVDEETSRRISLGFEYPAASGKVFSLSQNAQINWLGLELKASLLTYPYTIRTRNDKDSYDLVDEADAHNIVQEAFVTKETLLTMGRIVKTNIVSSVDTAAVDSAAASWLSGGPP